MSASLKKFKQAVDEMIADGDEDSLGKACAYANTKYQVHRCARDAKFTLLTEEEVAVAKAKMSK